MNPMKELTPDLLQEFSRSYAQKDGAQTLHTMLYKTDMADLSYVPLKGAALKGAFSVEVKTRGITAQEQSGRCWLFAALNILREKVAEKCKLDEFELSQNYLSFYDKLENPITFCRWSSTMPMNPLRGSSCSMCSRALPMEDTGAKPLISWKNTVLSPNRSSRKRTSQVIRLAL